MLQGGPEHAPITAMGIVQLLESLERAGVAQLGKIPDLSALPPMVAAVQAAAAPDTPVTRAVELPNTAPATAPVALPVPAAPAPIVSTPAQSASLEMPRRTKSASDSSGNSTAATAAPAPLWTDAEELPAPLPRAKRVAALEVLASEVAGCTRCRELAETRTQTVFGVGNPMARLCFCGEAPGGDEDRQGEPFVGKAGQLLNKIIQACTLRREDVYILNTLKCRPPNNRNPQPEETSNCRGYFERQLDLIRPEFICCLGSFAAQGVLGSRLSIGRLRGRFHDFRGAKVICTYHPAYLLRNPSAKKDTWEDMQMLMEAMGIELPS